MFDEVLLQSLQLCLGLLFTATLCATVFRYLKIPYTVGLLLVGIVLSILSKQTFAFDALNDVRLSTGLIMYVILPTLIFEAAINIDARQLLKNVIPILLLAVVGVLISTAIITLTLQQFTQLSLAVSLIFAAMISATDPVAVIALFRELNASKRLSLLMDGESLLNDATAIVLFGVLLALVSSNSSLGSTDLWASLLQFVSIFCGGALFGVAMGGLIVLLLRISKHDRFVQRSQMIILAYATFIVADHYLHLSGVMALLMAGMVVSLNRDRVMNNQCWEHITIFWEYAAFVGNSFIFLMIGMTESRLFFDLDHLVSILPLLLVTLLAVTVARAVIVFGLVPFSNFFRLAAPISGKIQVVMFWGGVRGAIPVALMMALPADMPGRSLIIEMVLATILVTLVLQGTTIKYLLRHFKLVDGHSPKVG